MSLVDKTIPVDFNFRPFSCWPEQYLPVNPERGGNHAEETHRHMPDELARLERSQVGIIATSQVPPPSGGFQEALPTRLNNEIEIARINLRSVLGDSISLRARQNASGAIEYSIVDEYNNDYIAWFDEKPHLLTLAELIEFINGSECEDMEGGGAGLLESYWYLQLEYGSPEHAVGFASIHSVFYPELETYFSEYAERWVDERYKEQEAEEEDI